MSCPGEVIATASLPSTVSAANARAAETVGSWLLFAANATPLPSVEAEAEIADKAPQRKPCNQPFIA